MSWYSKYLSVYNKTFDEIPSRTLQEIREKLQWINQSEQPLVSVVVIAHNEEKHLAACLWSLSDSLCRYPMEIIGVDNSSTDRTADIYKASGIPYYNETRKSCGYARRCGLEQVRGKYYICIDSDTMYPPRYVETLVQKLEQPGVVAVSSLWSYIPDKDHPWLGLKIYEFMRDTHLFLQSFKRPELSVRGLVFAYKVEYGKKVGYRVDIIRGEDGSMALGLKKFGKIAFVRKRKARAVTGYGTVSADGSFFNSFKTRIIKYLSGMKSYFTTKTDYKDEDSNLIK
ncbi:glycosyltransferase family 2 protein [Gabonibacter chumensis]|uniref:glycosyltransferase family 2 protein n=1 Tax=Gabonibacter chumensis TaxID=2972474 RepID=UPI002572FF02|nr:glycosyltransferase family 2 protein [Gabonibacter chumensis]MCR9013040.1 glycosyltransferase [Gabonibacter chumensis]